MRKTLERTVAHAIGTSSWFPGFAGITNVLGMILILALLQIPTPVFGATLPNSSSVTLAWERSPSAEVTGYCVYYGVVSGTYTNYVVAGDATTNTVTGLTRGATYFFVVTAYIASGLESLPSNELSYTVPVTVPGGLSMLAIRVAANRVVTLTVTGEAGHTYDIQTTPDFASWTDIGAVTIGANGSVDFVDTNAASSPKRFYRTLDSQP